MPPKKKRTRTAREEEEIARAQAFYAKLEADKKAKAAGVPTTSSTTTAAPKSVKKKVKAKVPKVSSKVTTKKPAPSAVAKKKESESDDEPPTPEKQPSTKRRKTSSALANQILEHSKGDESDGESKKPAKRTPQPPPAAYAGRADDTTMEIADAPPPVPPPPPQQQQQPVQPTKRTPQPPPASYAGTVAAANVAAPAAAARPRRARKTAVTQLDARESGNSTPPPRSMLKKKAPFGSPPPRRPSLMDPPDRSSVKQKPAPMMPRVVREPLRKEEEPVVAAPAVPPVHEPKEGDDDVAGIIPEEEPVDEPEMALAWSIGTKIALVSFIVALLARIAVSILPAPAAFISELVDSGVCFEDAGWTLETTPVDEDSEGPSPHCEGVQARSPCPGICSNGKLVSCGKYAEIKLEKCVLTPESLKIALALNDLVRLTTASCAFQPTCYHPFFSEFDDDADRPLFYFDKLVGRLGLENIDAELLKDANKYHNPMFLVKAREDGQVSVGVHSSLPLPQSFGTTLKRWVISSTKWTFFWILGIIRFLLRKLGGAWLACFRSSPWLTTLATFIGWILAVRWYSMRVNASLEAKVVHYRLRALNEIYESEGRETTSTAVFARIAWDEFPTRERDRNHFADTIWVHVERDVAKDPRVRKEVSRENGKTITHWVWTDSRAPNAED